MTFTRPLRILQCVGDIDPALGGSVEAARQLSLALAHLGHLPELVTLRRPDPHWLEAWHGAAHFTGPSATRYLYNPWLSSWIQRRVSAYDAVVIHGLWRYTSAGVWRGLRHSGVPYFVFPHGMLDPYFQRAFPRKHLQKYACWLAAERRVMRDARAVLFTSELERLRARNTFRPYACREKVVGLGIEEPPGEPAAQTAAFFARFPQLDGRRIVLFLGRLHPKKGCDLLVRAFAGVALRDSRWQLVIAGPDECGCRGDLQKLAMECGAGSRLTFTGPVHGDLKWGLLRTADVMALPSHTENFAIVVAEALACSVPVLISDQVNIWREVESDAAGFVAGDHLEGMTRLLSRWLALSETHRDWMRRRARRSFLERYESTRFAGRLLENVAA